MAIVRFQSCNCRSYNLRALQGLFFTIPARGFGYTRASPSNENPAQLFEYTSGRWLYNEALRISERKLYFNLDALKRAVAECLGVSESDVQDISKLAEGGDSVLARLPYPSTQPHRLAVASEAATLNLLQSCGIPVPRVLHYSTDVENQIGAEYMILEKVPGRSLADRWYDLNETERLNIISQIVKLEDKLSQIDLPAYGSIFHSRDLSADHERIPILPSQGDEDFCVGPSTALRWWHDERERLYVQQGPFREPLDLLLGMAKKELTWLKHFGRPRYPSDRAYREITEYQKSLPEEYADALEKFIAIAPWLIPHDKKLHRPIIWHQDFQPNNIFCTDDLEIVGLIDWQHSTVFPQFLAAGIPIYFSNYHDEGSLRYIPPKLPANYDNLDHEEQLEASEIYRRRHSHFYYLGFTQRLNPQHFEVLNRRTDLLIGKTIQHTSQPCEGNNIPLRSDLIHLTQIWQIVREENTSEVNSTISCPLTFTQADKDITLDQLRQQEETDTQISEVRDMIGVGNNGWTSNDHFSEAVDRARIVKDQALQNLGNDEKGV